MATHEIPDLTQRELADYINTQTLKASARNISALLSKLPELKVWKVQYKAPSYNDNAWYVGFTTQDEPILMNIKLTPANSFVEFRYPHYLPQDVFTRLKWQNSTWKYAPYTTYGEAGLIEIIKTYLDAVIIDYAVGKLKTGGKSSAEAVLFQLVQRLFPSESIERNRRPDDLRSSKNRPLELDLYLPAQKLAIEIQGPQHFKPVYGCNQALQDNDQLKKTWCKRQGIKLIWMNWEGITRNLFRLADDEQLLHLQMLLLRLRQHSYSFLLWDNVSSYQFEE